MGLQLKREKQNFSFTEDGGARTRGQEETED